MSDEDDTNKKTASGEAVLVYFFINLNSDTSKFV